MSESDGESAAGRELLHKSLNTESSSGNSSYDTYNGSEKFGRRLQDIIDNGIDECVPKYPYERVHKETRKFLKNKHKIGQGGFAKCYSAKLSIRGIQTEVAIKKINYENINEMYYCMYEIHVTGKLRHKNIAELFYYTQKKHNESDDEDEEDQEGFFLMIMEYGGVSLKECVIKDQLPHGKASLTICEHTNLGLAYLHHYSSDNPINQIIHRDLKYDNILIKIKSCGGKEYVRAKIIDFGIARNNYSEGDSTKSTTLRNVLGAKMFISPEVLDYAKKKIPIPPNVYNDKMDIYGSALNFFYSITGRLPYRMQGPYSKTTDKTIPVLPKGTEGFPLIVSNFLCKMLHPNFNMRPDAKTTANMMEQFKGRAHEN